MTFRQKTPSEANVENSETFQASLSETSSRRRQKETLNACKEIHGDQKGKKSSALAGMWVTLVNKSSTDTLKDFLSNSETVSKKIMPSIVKSETELYQSGNDNICRSLKILYEGGLLTKEKYKSVCRNILATVPNSSNVFNPKLLYYDKLRGGLVSIPQCIAVLDHCIHIINSPAQLAQCSLTVVVNTSQKIYRFRKWRIFFAPGMRLKLLFWKQ